MRRWTVVLHAALLCFAASLAREAPAAEPHPGQSALASRPWRVVLIRSWDSLYPANLAREAAFREAILARSPRNVELYPEEMDPLRFPGSTENELVVQLRRKYRDTPIELVIASGIEPLEFAARHRDEIWPGAAIIFNGIFQGWMDPAWVRPPRTTGVTMTLDVDGALALGRALVPSARKLYVVSGSAPFDQLLLGLATQKLAHLQPGLEVSYIAGLTREETTARVAALERDSLVLYLTMLRDANGVVSGPAATTMVQVASHSKAPVLSVIQTQFGRGVVGGSGPRYDMHGRAAGQLALRVLEGADPDLVPVQADPQPTCEVDWNALGRWEIPERYVPSQCQIVNRPPSLWSMYLWPVVGLISVILLQTALLSSVVIQSRRRQVAELRLRERTAEMALATRLSTIGALTANIAHEINQPIGTILSNAEAAQMMLEQSSLGPDKLREILADIRSESLHASEVIRGVRRLLARSEWKPSPLDVNVEVAEALRHVAFHAACHDVRITPVFGVEMPAVMGDSIQVQQVVINLVTNAIDAVSPLPRARREVRVETHARADGVEIAVLDRGPGLVPEIIAHLFEAHITTRKDGLGLGLTIVRSVVEMHGGRVWFEPNIPHGAAFRMRLMAVGA